MERFFDAFIIFEEEGIEHYDLTQMLTALFLLSKSSQSDKAASLFSLYDDNGEGELAKVQLETTLHRIVNTVFLYSEKLLDNDDGVVRIHELITETKVSLFISCILIAALCIHINY